MASSTYPIKNIAITGALGNLGTKLLRHLASLPGVERLVGLDIRPCPSDHVVKLLDRISTPPTLEFIQCNVADYQDIRWREVIATQVDAVVHFAADNPYPEATWAEAATSLDMTLNVALASADSESRVRRVVFATSNHVMGRYKDPPLTEQIGVGELTPALPPGVGAVWHTGEKSMDSTPYATAKLMGERVCCTAALRSGGRTTFVCIRIGWCQPGENLPSTLSAAGTPTQQSKEEEGQRDEAFARADQWWKKMWLSNRDFTQIFEHALFVGDDEGGKNWWQNGFLLVNGMSNNPGMKWSLVEARESLGYEPVDGFSS
ncbi:unnamed protein product [Didymodactylos carnosus]|uniref:NAD-dependent epimerase/dehydratase domain-containing protein n=1 Tax=Didymodactylos carnosus TaxID=1234261 RepID=A0A815DVC9_9BILA|nr:unnamed protein product [Didymodactylos carnosus]CAF4129568.1 unnamed protein product [Didymodactylos carnosus]